MRESSKKAGYIRSLDGWRAIAISLVLLAHGHDSLTEFFSLSQSHDINYIGLFGVRIFFALSGYLITLRIIEERDINGYLSLKGFYIRRFFRIIPPLLIFCLCTMVLGIFGIIPVSVTEWIGGVFFFSNFINKHWFMGHLWSLSVEEHFYLIWPIVFILTPKRNLHRLIVVSAMMLSIWRIFAWKYQLYSSPAIFWGRSDIQFDSLLWGCFFAVISRYSKSFVVEFFSSTFVFGFAFLFLLMSLIVKSDDYKIYMLVYPVQAALIAVMIFYTSTNTKNIFSLILERKPLRWVGRLSYSIYLWQQLFFVPNESLIGSRTLVQSFPFNVAVVLTVASLSYYLIEKRFIRLGHELAKPATEGRIA